MKKRICFLIAGALFLLSGIAYGANTEVWGDFSVNGGTYFYDAGQNLPGQLTPRCLCDTAVDASQECPQPGFYSDVDQGSVCYDQVNFGSVTPLYYSFEYVRQVATEPTFWVTPRGDAYVPTIGNGLILKAPNGNCYRVTVGNTGTLTQSLVSPCP